MNILILLIGSNPLPNYIVGHYLKKNRAEADVLPEPDKIILLHSGDTEKFARKISEQLKIQPEYANLKDKEREPSVIVKGIQDKLDSLSKTDEISSIHLNYTGGTKPMSLFSHTAVREWIEKEKKKDKIRVILSDIDPKNHKIVLREKPDYPLDGDLLDHVKPDIKTILELHNMRIDSAGQKDCCFSPEITNLFAKQAIEKSRKKDKDNKREKPIPKELKGINITLKGRHDEEKEKYLEKNSDKLNDLMEKTNNFFPYLSEHFENRTNIIQCPNLSFIKFIKEDGWLEDFILNTLIKLKESSRIDIHEIKKNVRASYDKRETQLDVVAIRGYKLFLISCTTDDGIKTVKEKAFEAIYRAEQLGGEHAKAIVVSLMYNNYEKGWEDNNLDVLQRDFQQFDSARNCRLIGIDDLQGECEGKGRLTQRLKNIILGVE